MIVALVCVWLYLWGLVLAGAVVGSSDEVDRPRWILLMVVALWPVFIPAFLLYAALPPDRWRN